MNYDFSMLMVSGYERASLDLIIFFPVVMRSIIVLIICWRLHRELEVGMIVNDVYKFCETITDYAIELSVKQWLNWQGWQLYVRNVIGGMWLEVTCIDWMNSKLKSWEVCNVNVPNKEEASQAWIGRKFIDSYKRTRI